MKKENNTVFIGSHGNKMLFEIEFDLLVLKGEMFKSSFRRKLTLEVNIANRKRMWDTNLSAVLYVMDRIDYLGAPAPSWRGKP